MKALLKKKSNEEKVEHVDEEEEWLKELKEKTKQHKKSFFVVLREKWNEWQLRMMYFEHSKTLILKQFAALCLAIFYSYVTLELYSRSQVYLVVFIPTIYLLLDYIHETRKREQK